MTDGLAKLRIATDCGACVNKCCSQPYDWVYLTESEIAHLEALSGKPRASFVGARKNMETGFTFQVLNLPCQFLEKETGRCGVYAARPLVCKLFPFYPEPLTGHATLIPAQCGDRLSFPPEGAPGWALSDYSATTARWLQDIWAEAGFRTGASRPEANSAKAGSP